MSIDQCLAEIQEAAAEGHKFSIRFITMEGEERFYEAARYGAPDSWQRKTKLDINERIGQAFRGKRRVSLMRDDGTIPITNLKTQEFRTPKWFGIIELHGEKVF